MITRAEGASAVRLAFRSLRSGLGGFRIFLMCLFLGVGAIAVVGSLSAAIEEGMRDRGQALLGGDVEFSFVHRRARSDELAFLTAAGKVSEVATLRAMASAGENRGLVEIKAVDMVYPHYDALEIADGADPTAVHDANTRGFGLYIEPTLADRLGVAPGGTVQIGEVAFTILGIIAREPDRVSDGFILGPRALMSQAALHATGLIKPGSLVRWRYRIKMPAPGERAIKRLVGDAKQQFADAGWRIRTSSRAAPGVDRFVERLTFFLTLVGLTALIVGGVGIANAVKAFIDNRRSSIATLKCIGAPSRLVLAAYATEIAIVATLGIAAGLAAGAATPFAAAALFGDVLPVPVSAGIEPVPLLRAAAFGYLITLAFSAWPLGRMRAVAPSALFRDQVAEARGWPGWPYMAATALGAALVSALAYTTLPDGRITLWYTGGVIASFCLLTGLARLVMMLAETRLSATSATARYAIANLYRPGAPTPSIILSLGLGLTLFVTLALVDKNISAELRSSIPAEAPSFFFLDVASGDREAFVDLVNGHPGIAGVKTAPMLRGRMVSVAGVKPGKVDATPDTRWALRGDRGLTYSQDLPAGSELVAGEWWPPDYDGPPLVSFTNDIAQGIGLELGDEVTVNVLGREVTAKVASFRRVDWRSLNINFVMVFSPNTLKGAPHMNIVTVNMVEDQAGALMNKVAKAYPTVTAVRVRDVLDAVNKLLADLVVAIRYATSLTFIVGILVLAGAMTTGLSRRIYDAVVLKTHGATRGQLARAYMIEFTVLGLVAAAFAIGLGSLAAWGIMTFVLEMPFAVDLGLSAVTALIAAILTLLAGFATTWRSLAARPARVLRTE